ncbi:MAG: hypothetical protein ABSE89_07190 [Sedimentisphaerales bacterium]
MKTLLSIIAVCISIIIFSPVSASVVPVSDQIAWGWNEHSDKVCVVERTQSTFNSGAIIGVDSGTSGFIKKIWVEASAQSPSENSLNICYQACRISFSPGNKPVDVNFSITMKTTVDSVLYYAIGAGSVNPIHVELF